MSQSITINIGTVDNVSREEHGSDSVLGKCKDVFGQNYVLHKVYTSSWVDGDGDSYSETCLAVKFSLNKCFLPVGAIESKLEALCNELGQEAIAYSTSIVDPEQGSRTEYCDMFYRGYRHVIDQDSCLKFNEEHFVRV